MEFSLDEIMAMSQQGTVKEYCDDFQFLYDRVKTFGEICEYYAIYLFMDGLEPKIRDVFIAWHQYSFHTLKDVISLALKLDANELKDSFSPYDPNSSLYDAFKVFGVNDSLEIGRVTDDDVLRENENDNKSASKVFDEMPSTFGTENGSLNLGLSIRVFDEMSKKSGNEIKEPLGDEIQELIETNASDVKKGDVSELKKEIKENINRMFWNVMCEGLDNDSKKIGKGNRVHIDFCKDVYGIGRIGTLFQHVWGEFEQGTVVKVLDEDSGVMEENPRHSFEKNKDVVTTWIKNTETGQFGVDSVVFETFVWKPGLTFSVENWWEAYINSHEYTTSGKLRDKEADIVVTTETNSTKEFGSCKKKKESS
ncbi:uncharacterized protein LOC143609273 [Bidens hawaiensis]|uniref:uncharacterized protein LOC143609273 n=1 Tax=Bidens hawaiensis TaxID=980011 RepID=UPI00404A0545